MKKFLLAALMVAMVFSCAVSAGATAAEAPSVSDGMIEFIDDMFQNKDNITQIIDENGNEVKYAFFLRHREDYKNGDYVSIPEDLANLSVITPADTEDTCLPCDSISNGPEKLIECFFMVGNTILFFMLLG